MKRLVLLLLALSAMSGVSAAAVADVPKKQGPDVINFKMGAMTLAFQHKKHLTALNNECFHCHKTENGKIDDWGKETAHTICIPCHDLYEKGPTECKGCHKK